MNYIGLPCGCVSAQKAGDVVVERKCKQHEFVEGAVRIEADGRASVGTKDDSGKLSYGLIPWTTLRPVVRVLMWGATKYGPENWRHVPDFRRRYFEAAMRHLTAWWEGEKADKDTGESHLAHLACCTLFLLAKELEA